MSEDFGRIISINNIRILYPKNIKLEDVEKMFSNFFSVIILQNGDKHTGPVKAKWQNKRHKICKIVPDTSNFRKYKEAYLEEKP